MAGGVNSTVPSPTTQNLNTIVAPAKADGVITANEATSVLASALEAKIPYSQAQAALQKAGFTGVASLGHAVYNRIDIDNRRAQAALHNLGYLSGDGQVDGQIGRHSKAAILQYQDDQGLPKTGVLDPATKASLTEAGNRDNLRWARQSLPEAQHKFDTLTQGKHLGFDQNDIARMTPEFASKRGVPAGVYAAALLVKSIEAHLPGAERGDLTQFDGLSQLREAQTFGILQALSTSLAIGQTN